MSTSPQPQDQRQRQRIREELAHSLLVEAAAGTGKTEEMTGRMVELLAQGECPSISGLVAITFTRKAAAELRARFQMSLEKAAAAASGARRERLQRALSQLDTCFVGTIHSFCARLLRERPVEAGVALDFREVEDDEDDDLRDEAWDLFCNKVTAGQRPEAQRWYDEILERGLSLTQLKPAFSTFAEYPDVNEWPCDAEAQRRLLVQGWPAMCQARLEVLPALQAFVESDLYPDAGGVVKNSLELSRLFLQTARHLDTPQQELSLLELVEGELPTLGPRSSLKLAHEGRLELIERAVQSLQQFAEVHARPMLEAWRVVRYEAVIRLLLFAREDYDALRHARGVLNYQDLLMRARDLLSGAGRRDAVPVRRYFRRRYTHLLVDEFQDTDPIQAEALLLLTADDPAQADWRRCHPVPGALFVVGDPKQSIYRFRRADIVTYNQVKSILCPDLDKDPIRLASNFRSTGDITGWVNAVFQDSFPATANKHAPAYVPLLNDRRDGPRGQFHGLRQITIPPEHSAGEAAAEYEADFAARVIRHAVQEGISVTRTEKQIKDGRSNAVQYEDFLLIAWKKKNLSLYARALERYGVPHQVAGGAALNELEELRLLHLCLNAVAQPDDPVALIAALRSELFGISDRALYAFRKAGGHFSYCSELPQTVAAPGAPFADAFERLKRYARWIDRLPLAAAVECIVEDLGLLPRAAAREGGAAKAGGLAKVIELVRTESHQRWSLSHLADYLARLVEEKRDQAKDSLSALSLEGSGVSLMNLHKAKGLQAPIAFLIDPNGKPKAKPDVGIRVCRPGSGAVRGYLHITEPRGEYQQHTLALPAGWAEREEAEREFIVAEQTRLLYVAGTRAACCLVVVKRSSAPDAGGKMRNWNQYNPWQKFTESLKNAEELASAEVKRPPLQVADLKSEEIAAAAQEVAGRLASSRAPTYQLLAAKSYALANMPAQAAAQPVDAVSSVAGADHGLRWGEAIHALLDLAMRSPGADLTGHARDGLAEREVPVELADEAVAVVRAVMASPLWARAHAARRCFTEAPFQLLADRTIVPDAKQPALLSGVIDLVFEEEDGWVIVDYKTDKPKGKDLAPLVAQYRPQVNLYARVWRQCTNENIKETGLFFVTAGAYMPVTESANPDYS